MPKDPRPFITVHNGMPEHPKVFPLSDAAFRLIVSAWCLCNRTEIDGVLSAAAWKKQGTARARAELVAAGLAEIRPNGDVELHDYLEHQRSAAEIRELRNKRREAGSKGGKKTASAKANAAARTEQEQQHDDSKTQADSRSKSSTNSPSSPGSGNVPPGALARIVKAYAEQSALAKMPCPVEQQAKVERSAASLFAQGYPEDVIEQAARSAAVAGWFDLATQMQRDAARHTGGTTGRISTTEERAAVGVQLAARLADQERKAIAG